MSETDNLEPEGVVLEDGVVIYDIKKGKGRKKAKESDQVTIFYENRIESNDKIQVVGHLQTGVGLKFSLGENDGTVLRAWHIGIIGMKIGSKRKLICPPSTAYGENGYPPFIPGGVTLISEIELLAID